MKPVDYKAQRDFATLLADRNPVCSNAPQYAEQVTAIVDVDRRGAARRKARVLVWQRRKRGRGPTHVRPSFPGTDYLRERPGLNSEALSVNSWTLTCVGNDYGYDFVFSRQVEAFAQAERRADRDDHERNVAQHRARDAGGPQGRARSTVAFTGNRGGSVMDFADLALMGPSGYAAIVQEVHQVMAHIVCDLVEQRMIFEGDFS